MNFVLQRTHTDGIRTFGKLYAEGNFACFTLEDAVREVPGQPVSAWKVVGRTAIPAGEYKLTLENSPRFGVDTLSIPDVPGFAGIRIHAGNTERDTEGCPLLGMAIDENGIVGGTSRKAVDLVKAMVKKERAAGTGCRIAIKQIPEA